MHSTIAAMNYMSKDKNGNGGDIVQIASIAGINPFPFCPIYCASKFAIVGFARSLGVSNYIAKKFYKINFHYVR